MQGFFPYLIIFISELIMSFGYGCYVFLRYKPFMKFLLRNVSSTVKRITQSALWIPMSEKSTKV